MSRQARLSSPRRAFGELVLALALIVLPAGGSATAQSACTGDCNESAQVTIDELIRAVNIALDLQPLSVCPIIDRNHNGAAAIDEVITAVNYALFGCPAAVSPTPTPTPTFPAGHLVVSAGADVIVPLDGEAMLVGSATRDGTPVPGATRVEWVQLDGPGTVTFRSAGSLTTTAHASAIGSYRLRLTVTIGSESASDEMLLHADLAAANEAPTLEPIADQTIAAGTTLHLELVGRDPNPFDALTYSLVSGPAGAVVDPTGILRFAPLADQLGSHPVTVRVADAGGLAAQRDLRVHVVTGNRPPEFGALPDAVIASLAPFARPLTATDPDGDALAFALVSGPEGMQLDGSQLAWTPAAGQFGTFVVRVQVADAAGASAPGEFRILVPSPAAPHADDDRYEVRLGHTLAVPAAGVLANDASVDGRPLTATALTPPDKGMVTAFAGDGSFTFQAPPALPPPPPLDPTIKYQVHVGNGVNIGAYPVRVADIDGDGKLEIIFWRGDTMIAVRGGSGEELLRASSLPEPYQECAMYGRYADEFAVADVDDDGVVEIVMGVQCRGDNPTYIFATDNASRLAALAYDPEAPEHVRVKWLTEPLSPTVPYTEGDGHLYVPFGGQAAFTSMSIARLRPTEAPTVLLGKTYSSGGGPRSYCGQTVPGKVDPHCRIVFAVDGATGARKTPYYAAPEDPGSVDAYAGGLFGGPSPVSVADVNDDGELDILYQGTLWNVDGSVQRQFDGTPSTSSGTANSLVIDLDGDAAMEIVTLDAANYRRAGILRAWKADGRLLWKVTLPADTVYTRLSAADVDRSGRPTILFAIRTTLYAVDHTGQFKWVREFPHDVSGYHSMVSGTGTGFPVYDLNGDGVVEIILQYSKSTILFLRGDTAETQTSWSYPGGDDRGMQSVQAPVIADVDGTGEASLIWYHDVNLNDHSFLQVMKGGTAPWRAAPTHVNQHAAWGTNFNPDGSVPRTYPRHTADPASNVFAQQPPVPYALEPRLRTQAQFTYAAQSGGLASSPARVTIDILPENRPPIVTALPPEVLPVADYRDPQYTFQLAGTDPDPGDALTFGPAGEQRCGFEGRASISPQGLFSYWGRTGPDDQCFFRVTLSDDQGATVSAPLILSFADQQRIVPDVVGLERSAALNEIVRRDLTGAPPLTTASSAPAGQVVAQQPAAGSEVLRGSRVQFTVSLGPGPADTDADGDGFTPNQGDCDDGDAALNPARPEVADNGIDENCDGSERVVREVRIAPARALRVTGEQVPFTATAVYVDGTSASVTPNWAAIAPNIASITPAGIGRALNIGSTEIRAVFGGAVGHATFAVADRAAGDQDEPTALISTPAEGASVSGLTQITGTATDPTFLRYELALAPAGEEAFALIGEGTAAVVDGALGVLDPTLLINGHYTLRLTVFDANENSASAEVSLLVEGGQKAGNFSLAYTDLAIPLAGLPIQVRRSYDSRDKQAGDFGVGWRLAVNTLRISPSRVLGSGWEVRRAGLSFALVPHGDHRVSITLPSGRVERFDLVLTPSVSAFVPLSALRASYVAHPGSRGTLESLDNNELRIVDAQPGPVTLLDDETLNDYHPNRFRYTAPDGTQYVVTRLGGVESVRDPQANQLAIGAGGIIHSSGQSVLFTRDGQGRITAITDPKGQTQTYTYSPSGDLAAHTDAEGHTTAFFYDSRHGLVRIVDPLGRAVTRTEYDEAGRLIAVTNAAGDTTHYAHDPLGRQAVETDALGRVTVSEYDERGNVVAITDPLGARRLLAYDERDNLLRETDPLGETTSYTYDGNDHLTSVTDPLGRTTTYTSDEAGRPLSMRDARGNLTTMAYDAGGNLTAMTDALGGTMSATYDGAGNLLSLTEPGGITSANQYDAAGRRTRLTDALGRATTMQYDANGNLLAQQGSTDAAWALRYDANNRIVTSGFGDLGRSVAYDAAGRLTALSTAAGQVMDVTLDAAGRPTALRGPGGAPLFEQAYDAAGNPVAVTDAVGNVAVRTYDAADRLVATRYPDGGTERRVYDAAGRLTAVTDQLGHTTSYAYDAAGQLITVTDALGGQTHTAYDANGNLVSQTDPRGQTTTFAHDALNRLVQVTYPDGATESRSYDAAGRIAAVVDAAGNSLTYAYDALGRLTSVTDQLGQVTRHEYVGNAQRTATIDAAGRTTRFAYDGAGRLATITYPLGDAETTAYDAAGNVAARTNGAGQTVQYLRDSTGRFSGVALPDGSTEQFTYTADERLETITDARGVTRLTYHPTTRRLIRVTQPDGRYIRYDYDFAGNRILMAYGGPALSEFITRYQYDALRRLTRLTDPFGGVTTQSYDAAGNLLATVRPNGVRTQRTYDARNRVVSITEHAPDNSIIASETATLDLFGNRTRIDRHDGAHVTYDYDALGRVTRERHVDGDGATVFESVYAYDAAGNLVASGPPGAALTYVYNANDQLIAGDGVTYAYDGAGRRVQASWTPPGQPAQAVQYIWDAKDRLVGFRDAGGTLTEYSYDAEDARQGKVAPAGLTAFQVDPRNDTGYAQIVHQAAPDGERHFVFGQRLLQTREGGVTRHHLGDHLGSTRRLAETGGAVTAAFDYASYGDLVSQEGSAVPHGFAGEQRDPESGLTYLRARYYDPATGGFLSRDALLGNPADPLSQHRYLYALGNPVNRTDPSGNLSIAETLVSSYNRLAAQGQRILQVRRGLGKASDVTADVMRATGGLLAFYTLAEAARDKSRLEKWFGTGAVSSAAKLLDAVGLDGLAFFTDAVAHGIDALAFGALSLTTFDMIGGREVSIEIQGLGVLTSRNIGDLKKFKDNKAAAAECAEGGFAYGGIVDRQAVMLLCARFFKQPVLPSPDTLTIPGNPSMPGVMVHEFTHISFGATDDAYNCTLGYGDPDTGFFKQGVKLLRNQAPGANLRNADTYACWVEDSAVGWANAAPKIRGGR